MHSNILGYPTKPSAPLHEARTVELWAERATQIFESQSVERFRWTFYFLVMTHFENYVLLEALGASWEPGLGLKTLPKSIAVILTENRPGDQV